VHWPGWRSVPITRSPRARAAYAVARPMPLEAPVMNQVRAVGVEDEEDMGTG